MRVVVSPGLGVLLIFSKVVSITGLTLLVVITLSSFTDKVKESICSELLPAFVITGVTFKEKPSCELKYVPFGKTISALTLLKLPEEFSNVAEPLAVACCALTGDKSTLLRLIRPNR